MPELNEVPQIVKQILIYSDGSEKVVIYNDIESRWEEPVISETSEVASEAPAEESAVEPVAEAKEEVSEAPVEESTPENPVHSEFHAEA